MKMESMLRYQQIDGQIKSIISRLNGSDECIRGKKLGQFLKESEEKLKKMNKRAEELNASVARLKNVYAQSVKDFDEMEKGVEAAIDREELNYLTKKLSETTKSLGAIEKELNAAVREMEDITKRYDELRGKVPTAQSQYKDCRGKFEKMKKDCEPEVSRLRSQLQALEKEIPPEIMEKYQKLRGQKIYPVIVPLAGGNKCGGCQMEVSIGAKGKLDEKGFVDCENCQRLIYKPE